VPWMLSENTVKTKAKLLRQKSSKINRPKSMLIITKSYLQITNKYFLLFKNIDKVHVIRSHAREERLIK
jgi:hypothetical protein